MATVGLLAARLVEAPPLSDPLGGPLPSGLHLTTPWLYALFGPLFSLWDGVSMLSMSRLRGFLIGLLLAFLLWRSGRALWWRFAWSDAPPPRSPLRRELKLLAGSFLLVLLFVLVGLLWHRPMLALAGVGRDDAAVDFHSHTNVSHDVRHTLMRWYDTEANLRWHRRAGFDLVRDLFGQQLRIICVVAQHADARQYEAARSQARLRAPQPPSPERNVSLQWRLSSILLSVVLSDVDDTWGAIRDGGMESYDV